MWGVLRADSDASVPHEQPAQYCTVQKRLGCSQEDTSEGGLAGRIPMLSVLGLIYVPGMCIFLQLGGVGTSI